MNLQPFSTQRAVFLAIVVGAIIALVGNMVAIEIVADLAIFGGEREYPIKDYLFRVGISLLVAAWISALFSLFIVRSRRLEAEATLRRSKSIIFTDQETELPNATWLEHTLRFGLDAIDETPVRSHILILHSVIWWDHIQTLFSNSEKTELWKAVKAELIDSVPRHYKLGYLGSGVLYSLCERDEITESVASILEFQFLGRSIRVVSLQTSIFENFDVQRSVILGQQMRHAIERSEGMDGDLSSERYLFSKSTSDAWRAILSGRIGFVYQPIFRLADEKIHGLEILVRLKDEQGNLVPMDEGVLQLLESSPVSMIFHDRLVSELHRIQKKLDQLSPELQISINVPAPILTTSDFEAILQRELDSGLSAERVAFEITERTLPVGAPHIKSAIDRLRSIGIRIHLDDFGAGQSSIETLYMYHFDLVKIDRIFIINNYWSKVRTESLIGFLKSYGATVLVEGVEDNRLSQVFAASGADFVQSFMYSRPLDEEALTKRLGCARTGGSG